MLFIRLLPEVSSTDPTSEYIWYLVYYSQRIHDNVIANYQLFELIFQLISISKVMLNSVMYAYFVPEGKQILQQLYCIKLKKATKYK